MSTLIKYLGLTFNFRDAEVIISSILTSVFLYIFWIIGLYPNFISYQTFLIDICIDLLLSQIALMGVLITALALLVTLFNTPERIEKINKFDEEPNVDALLNDFPYISILILFHIIISLILILLMKSNYSAASIVVFYVITFVYVYLLTNILVRVTFISFITVNVFKGIRSVEKCGLIEQEEQSNKSIATKKQVRIVYIVRRKRKRKSSKNL